MTENDNVLSHFLSDVLLPSVVADHLIMVTFYHLYHLMMVTSSLIRSQPCLPPL